MEKENLITKASMDFAVRIVNLYKKLSYTHKEFILSKQILRSGTSIGANIAESQGAQSNADFIAKLHISLKECRETEYWLNLLLRTNYITDLDYKSIKADLNIIIATLINILKATKSKPS